MKSNNVPIRKCIGCGLRRPKGELIRIVKRKENDKINIFVSSTHAEGRGAYLCRSEDCLKKARKGRRLERAFSGKVDSSVYDDLEKRVSESE